MKRVTFLLLILTLTLSVSLFSGFVVAQESPESCVESCKSTCYDEECRSKCITECKSRLDFDDMEMSEAQYDMHMPKECVEAGVTSPKECGEIMIKTNAPD